MKYFKTYNITYIFIILSCIESFFWAPYTCLSFQQKHIYNPFKHLRWSIFPSPVNNFKSLTVSTKTLHLRCLKRFWIRLVLISSNSVLCHHNKRQVGYLEFLYGSGIICLPLNIPKKLHLQHLFEKPEEAETHRLYLS